MCKQMLQDHSDTPFDVLMHVGDISYASVAVDVDSLSANDGGGELVGICHHRVIFNPMAGAGLGCLVNTSGAFSM